MNIKEIDKWLDEEYGCSYTKLEELNDFYFEKYCDLKEEKQQLKEHIEKYEHYCKTTGIEELMQQSQKYKEVIDKAINLIVKETKSMPMNGCKIRLIELLDILKEVE